MATEVSICNQALSLVGANPIISLNDNTTEAKLCKAIYDPVRDALLEEHAWTFAIKWIDIPKLASPPLSEFKNAFPLPSDVMRVLFVGTDYNNQVSNYRREGNNIVMDEDNCKCQVIWRIIDPNSYSSSFIQALSAKMAAELANPITNSKTLMESLYALYERKLRTAVGTDNQQGKPRRIRSKWALGARIGGVRGGMPYV